MSHRSERDVGPTVYNKFIPRTKRVCVLVGFVLFIVSIYRVYSGRCRFFQSPHFVDSIIYEHRYR
jgi:hypothetical protein